MVGKTDPFPLIRTKLQKPRLPGDLIPRRRLLDRLPAPNGPFALALRIYWPGQNILDGRWEPSAILEVSKPD